LAGPPTHRSSASGAARGIAALDRLAEELATAAGVELGVADSPSELIAAHRLRYRDASSHGRATAADDADGIERDVFDARALQICAWDGDVLVGVLRLVLPMPGKRLPTEEIVGLDVAPAGEVVDVGQPVVELGGERGRRAAAGLFAQAWFETRARGYLVMAGIVPERLLDRYRELGLDVEVLAHGDGDRCSVRLDPSVG